MVETPAPATRVQRRRRAPALAAVAAIAFAGTATAAAATSGFGLFSGYVGDDPLISTQTWGPDWEQRVEAYAWPPGFDKAYFVDGQVEGGKARPDAVPSRDLDREVLALNACAWTSAYQSRLELGSEAGRKDALATLAEALERPVVGALGDDVLVKDVADITSKRSPTAETQEFLSTTCSHGLVQGAIKDVR